MNNTINIEWFSAAGFLMRNYDIDMRDIPDTINDLWIKYPRELNEMAKILQEQELLRTGKNPNSDKAIINKVLTEETISMKLYESEMYHLQANHEQVVELMEFKHKEEIANKDEVIRLLSEQIYKLEQKLKELRVAYIIDKMQDLKGETSDTKRTV